MPRTLIACIFAAALSSTAIAGDMKSHNHSDHKQASQEAGLKIVGAFARATLPNQPVGGGFLEIVNTTDKDDRLIAVSSPISGRGEIHEMAMSGDTMKMRELPNGLVVPAGATVKLEPGGLHLMFMDLAKPFVAGETVEVTLKFEHAGEMTMTFAILERGAKAMDHSHGHGHGS